MDVHHIAVCANCRFREIGSDKEDAEELGTSIAKLNPTIR